MAFQAKPNRRNNAHTIKNQNYLFFFLIFQNKHFTLNIFGMTPLNARTKFDDQTKRY